MSIVLRLRLITIWLCVGLSFTVLAGIQPKVPFGRIGMLIRYQGSPSEPVFAATANITWGRKSDRNWCITLMTCACGSAATRTGTELESIPPAAGKDFATGIFGFFGVVVVVGVVVVPVVLAPVVDAPVLPASARVGNTTAAANPATARRTEAMRTRRLT